VWGLNGKWTNEKQQIEKKKGGGAGRFLLGYKEVKIKLTLTAASVHFELGRMHF